MRILQVNDYGCIVGGAEKYFFHIFSALQTAGHEVLSVTSNRKYKDKIFLSNLQIKESGHFFNLDSFFNPINYFEFKNILNDFAPDIIHFHNIFYALSPSVIYASKNYKKVLTLHDYAAICHGDKRLADGSICQQSLNRCCQCSEHANLKAVLKKKIGLKALRNIDQLIAPSQFIKRQFEVNGFNNISYLPHPLTYKNSIVSEGTLKDRKDFLFIGRLAEQKGVALLINAFAQFASESKLHIAGSGPEEINLKAQCQQLGITERVVFHGWVDEEKCKELLRQALAVVVPSIWPEIAPLVVGEAATYSVPVLAANIGGLSEMILNQKTGLLFKAGDLKNLVETLKFADEHRDLLLTYGKAANEFAAGQTIKQHLISLLAIYQ